MVVEEKVKCKICGKVGLAKDAKGLARHLRLSHNKNVSKKFNIETYYEPADPDSVIQIVSGLRKDFLKERKRKTFRKYKLSSGSTSTSVKNPYAKIIYTPMANG